MQIVFDEELNGTRVRAEIEVVQANALRSITRTRLIMEAGDFPASGDGGPPSPTQVDRFMLRRTVYPDLIAATAGGWIEIGEQSYSLPDLPFAAFEEIPFMLLVEWEQAAYRQNPHWLPETAEAKKKALPSGSGDLKPSTRSRKKKAFPNSST